MPHFQKRDLLTLTEGELLILRSMLASARLRTKRRTKVSKKIAAYLRKRLPH